MSPCFSCKYDGKCKNCFYSVYGKEYAIYFKNGNRDISHNELAQNQDKFVEKIWRECTDVAFVENEDYELVLDQPWRGFPVGEFTQDDWFHWVDSHHSKGVGWVFENINLYDLNEEEM